MKLLLYLFICLSIACKSNHSKEDNNQLLTKQKILKTKQKKEEIILVWDTLSINQAKMNNYSFRLNKSFIEQGKIDSTFTQLWQCGNPFNWEIENNGDDAFQHFLIKNLEYVSHENDVRLIRGDIKNNVIKLQNRNYVLDEYTKISDFKKIFPLSYKKYIKEKESNSDIFIIYDYIQVSFNSNYPEHQWFFYFNKDGFLVKFELYWWLC